MNSDTPPVDAYVDVDVEKKCGVLMPNGKCCNRRISCKSHSMAAKRAVAGRSQPYDVLLAAYLEKRRALKEEEEEEAQAGS